MNLLHNPVKINEFLANQKIRFSYLLGLSGLEPPTSRLSGARSNQLSYKPTAVPQPIFVVLQAEIVFQPSTVKSVRSYLSDPTTRNGDDGIRTHDPLLAGQVLSQLSYTPVASRHTRSSVFSQLSLPNSHDRCVRPLLRYLVRTSYLSDLSLKIEQQSYFMTPINGPSCACPLQFSLERR